MIHNLFKVHRLNKDGFAKAEELAQEFSKLASFIEQNVPEGRERSITMTHLQDAAFHAKRGIAEIPAHQEEAVATTKETP